MENTLNRHYVLTNLIVISSIRQKFLKTSLELYGLQFDMEEISVLSITTMLELLNNFIRTRLTVKSRDYNTLLCCNKMLRCYAVDK